MLRVVEGICDAHTAAWSSLPFFGTAKATLSANLIALTAAIGQQSTGTKGATAQKKIYRTAMEEDLLRLAAAVQLHCRFSGDETAAREASLTPSGISVMGDNGLLGLAVRIEGRANDIGAAGLLPYGVDGAFLTAFTLKLESYQNSIDNPSQAEQEQMKSTADIARILKESLTLLDTQLDVATELIKAAQPNFYAEYWTARKIEDAGHAPRTLTVCVTDSTTGKPLERVKASLMPGKLKRKTSPAGRFYVQTLATGLYTLTLVREGYALVVQEVRVDKGGRAEVVVQMQPE